MMKILVDQTHQSVHLFRKLQRASLIAEKTSTNIPVEYVNYANVFFPDLASKLLKYTSINDYPIDLNIYITR